MKNLNFTKQEFFLGVIFFILVVTGIFLLARLPFFETINESFLDYMRKGLAPRSEIVILKIDDQALTEVGPWPWNRDKYASAITELDKMGVKTIAFDVLFLENREGDAVLNNALHEVKTPVIFAGTFSGGKFLSPIFATDNTRYGYSNIVSDSDGKVRRIQIAAESGNECIGSFALSSYALFRYGSGRDLACSGTTINLNSKTYAGILTFNYIPGSFTEYSMADLLSGKLQSGQLKNKIVLIGATASGLNTDLSDVFVSIDGDKIPGVRIQANIINSFLSDKFQSSPSDLATFLIGLAVALFIFAVINFQRHAFLEYSMILASVLLINLLGIGIYEFGINFPFVLVNLCALSGYLFRITYRYLTKSRESAFVKKAFSQYVNPVILSKILSDPAMLNLGGEKKDVTVMFADIRGFTSISENADPHTLFALMNEYLTVMSNIIMENGGTIDKYIGDAIMTFWNAPLASKDANLNALTTAIKMSDALKEFNKSILKDPKYASLKQSLGDGIHIGIGMHYGPAIVGNLGSEKRFNYTAIGDSVNISSRLESLTKFYKVGIIVSQEVVNSTIPDLFSMRIMDEVVVKGRKTPIRIFEVTEKTPEADKLYETYAQAFELYQKGELQTALKLFKTLRADGPADMMIERILSKKINPEDKGVWYWDQK